MILYEFNKDNVLNTALDTFITRKRLPFSTWWKLFLALSILNAVSLRWMTSITNVALVYFPDCLSVWLNPIEICSIKSTNWIQYRTETPSCLCADNIPPASIKKTLIWSMIAHATTSKSTGHDKRTLAFRSQIPPLGRTAACQEPCCGMKMKTYWSSRIWGSLRRGNQIRDIMFKVTLC